jgi:hypothetical protein
MLVVVLPLVAVVAVVVAVEDNYWQKRPATRASTVT